jgi:hypothetical protein
MRDFFAVLCVRLAHWWDRNEEDAQETFNETLHLAPHYGEHASHALPYVIAFSVEAAAATAAATGWAIGHLSGAAGVLYVAVTCYQVRVYGLRGWLHYGAGTGVEADVRKAVHFVEHKVEDEVHNIEDDVRHIEVDIGHAFHGDTDAA